MTRELTTEEVTYDAITFIDLRINDENPGSVSYEIPEEFKGDFDPTPVVEEFTKRGYQVTCHHFDKIEEAHGLIGILVGMFVPAPKAIRTLVPTITVSWERGHDHD